MLPIVYAADVTGLESAETVLTAIWTAVGSVVTTIGTTPLLLIPVGFVFAGAAVGLAKGLMGSKRRRR